MAHRRAIKTWLQVVTHPRAHKHACMPLNWRGHLRRFGMEPKIGIVSSLAALVRRLLSRRIEARTAGQETNRDRVSEKKIVKSHSRGEIPVNMKNHILLSTSFWFLFRHLIKRSSANYKSPLSLLSLSTHFSNKCNYNKGFYVLPDILVLNVSN